MAMRTSATTNKEIVIIHHHATNSLNDFISIILNAILFKKLSFLPEKFIYCFMFIFMEKKVTVKIDGDVWKEARKKAIDNDITMSKVIEGFLKDWVKGK